MAENALFCVRNKQSASSGEPPSFDGNTPNRYHSYFENGYGEQLVFIYDRESDTATLYHSDLGWEHPRPVEEGGRCPSIVLDQAEMLWLRACWLAATEGKRARGIASPGDSDEQ
jgi:hypothetical protein